MANLGKRQLSEVKEKDMRLNNIILDTGYFFDLLGKLERKIDFTWTVQEIEGQEIFKLYSDKANWAKAKPIMTKHYSKVKTQLKSLNA